MRKNILQGAPPSRNANSVFYFSVGVGVDKVAGLHWLPEDVDITVKYQCNLCGLRLHWACLGNRFDFDRAVELPPKPTDLPPDDGLADTLAPETASLPGDAQEPTVCPVALEREAVLQVIRSGSGISADDLAEALSEKFDFTPDCLSLHLVALQSDELVMSQNGLWVAAEVPVDTARELPPEFCNPDDEHTTQPAN